MKGKAQFTEDEIEQISLLIEQKLKANTEDQKKIRNQIRALGFYASDFGIRDGYTVEDFKNSIATKDNEEVMVTGSFTWVNAHKGITEWLKGKKSNQKELIKILADAGATVFMDKDEGDKIIDLEEIEPFTFYCYIYKYGVDKRLSILQNICKSIGISPVPTDEKGIPSANAQSVWLFPYKHTRKNNEIERLWSFFYSALEDKLDDKLFADVLTIHSTGKTKLTEGLFDIAPDKYFPVNGPTKPYLLNVLSINPKFDTFSQYKVILEQIKQKTSKPFYEISYDAWLWNNANKDARKYWRLGTSDPEKSYWDMMKSDSIIAIGWPEIGDLEKSKASTKRDIAVLLEKAEYYLDDQGTKTRKSGEILNFFKQASIGDVVLAQNGAEVLGIGIIEDDYEYVTGTNFPHHRRIEWKKTDPQIKNSDGLRTTFVELVNPTLIKQIESLLGEESPTPGSQITNTSMIPLNQILYGPPGTGKTHTLLKEYYPLFTSQKQEVSEGQYKIELVSKYTWWQIVAAAVLDLKSTHVTQILNHELVQIKDSVSDQKNARAMIWAMLQQHTKAECEYVKYSKRYEPLFFNKDKDGNWTIDATIADAEAPEVRELLNSWKKPTTQNKEEIKRFEFITFHQSFSYEDFVEGIKPIMEEEAEEGDIRYKIEDGIFKRLCTKARRDSENDYALFIDEINRGNVSQIFGELITLIEDDKREGKPNMIEVELPYSKKKFSVPSNLYIIGTMNTADRSVEALDTALRRRFSFTEMVPRYDLKELQTTVAGFTPSSILQKINSRLEKLLDKDHLIGHSYFLDIDGDLSKLVVAFQHRIIPLLQEYFYGDAGKIGLVLGKGFFEEIEKENDSIFADFEYDSSGLAERKVYRLINLIDKNYKISDRQFKEAIAALMK